MHINLIQKLADLLIRLGVIGVVRQVHLFFLNGADQALRVPILSRVPHRRHAGLHLRVTQHLNIGGGSILAPLIRVMDLRGALEQRPPQGRQGQLRVQETPQVPPADTANRSINTARNTNSRGSRM